MLQPQHDNPQTFEYAKGLGWLFLALPSQCVLEKSNTSRLTSVQSL